MRSMVISTHAPLTRCDDGRDRLLLLDAHFYSRTSYEVRRKRRPRRPNDRKFLLTHLLRGATLSYFLFFLAFLHFYSRTSYEVRHLQPFIPHVHPDISTHAPLTRCDVEQDSRIADLENFYSRTSYEVRLRSKQICYCV